MESIPVQRIQGTSTRAKVGQILSGTLEDGSTALGDTLYEKKKQNVVKTYYFTLFYLICCIFIEAELYFI